MISSMEEVQTCKKQGINALIPAHLVPLHSMQYPRVDSIATDINVSYPHHLGTPASRYAHSLDIYLSSLMYQT